MQKDVLYLHYGAQCPGYRYMGEQGQNLAAVLGRPYRWIDVARRPEYAERHSMFFPGMIVIDDFSLVYPGRVDQMLDSYRRRGPIPGEMHWVAKPQVEPDEILPLVPGRADEAASICIKGTSCVQDKKNWLRIEARELVGGEVGYLGRVGGRAVAAVEFVREDRVPYPLGRRSEGSIFVTCLYGVASAPEDYRLALLMALKGRARDLGYRRIRAVTGNETPYPNGPWPTFEAAGFQRGPFLGRALLRHRHEDMYLVLLDLNGESGSAR